MLYLGLPLLFFAYTMPEDSYLTLYGTEKHVDLGFVLVGLLVYAGFLAGSFFLVRAGSDSQEGAVVGYCRWVVWPLFALTLAGYLVWFASAALNAGGPGALAGVLAGSLSDAESGDTYYIKQELFQTIPGVTTLTQLGMLYVTVEALLWANRACPRRASVLRFSPILALTLVRALTVSERLALVELMVPIGVVLLSRARWTLARRALVRFAPLLAGVGMFALFALGEYFRSWSTHYQYYYAGPYLNFAAERFLGYYATALNNAAVYYYQAPIQPLFSTLNSLFEFPVLGGLAYAVYTSGLGLPVASNEQLLTTYANVEFNNVSMLGMLLNDFTIFAAPLAAFVIGMVSFSIYTSFIRGRMLGMLLYPSWFIGLLEISRIYYWPGGRYFPVLAFLAVSLILFKLYKTPAPAPAARRGRSGPVSGYRGNPEGGLRT